MTTITTSQIGFSKVLDSSLATGSGILDFAFGTTNITAENKWYKSDDRNMLKIGSKAITEYSSGLNDDTLDISDSPGAPGIDDLVTISCACLRQRQEQVGQWMANAVAKAWKKTLDAETRRTASQA